MRTVRMSADDITIGDMELFEELTGDDIMDALTPVPVVDKETGQMVPDPDPDAKGRPLMETKVSSKQFRALLFIALRHEEPDLTLEGFKSIKLAEIDFDIDDEDTKDSKKEETNV